MAAIVARSPSPDADRNPISLTHALSTITAAPAAELPAVEKSNMLHQYIAFGGDDQGSGQPERHFLTQALQGSTFR